MRLVLTTEIYSKRFQQLNFVAKDSRQTREYQKCFKALVWRRGKKSHFLICNFTGSNPFIKGVKCMSSLLQKLTVQ